MKDVGANGPLISSKGVLIGNRQDLHMRLSVKRSSPMTFPPASTPCFPNRAGIGWKMVLMVQLPVRLAAWTAVYNASWVEMIFVTMSTSFATVMVRKVSL